MDRGPIHDLYTVLNTTETLNSYILATDWDIGINQKGISIARFSLSSERILIKILIFSFFVNFSSKIEYAYWKLKLIVFLNKISRKINSRIHMELYKQHINELWKLMQIKIFNLYWKIK